MAYDPQRHNRRSIRLKGFNYASPGAYFVTICTHGRERLFGQIKGGAPALSPHGQVVAETWRRIPRHFAHVQVDAFVVMPDHIHGIVVIRERLACARLESGGRPKGTAPGSLPAIVQNFKAVSARRINGLRGSPGRRVWQEDYYEHIVRDEAALAAIRQYIENNPRRWRE